jgi:hypothetical protein
MENYDSETKKYVLKSTGIAVYSLRQAAFYFAWPSNFLNEGFNSESMVKSLESKSICLQNTRGL